MSGPCRLSCLADGAQEFSPTPPAGLVRLGRTWTERAVTPGSVAPASARESTRRFRVNTGLFVFGSLAPSGPQSPRWQTVLLDRVLPSCLTFGVPVSVVLEHVAAACPSGDVVAVR